MTEPRTSPESESVTRAAQWVSELKGDEFEKIIPTIKERFGLTNSEAARACTLAVQFRLARRAHG